MAYDLYPAIDANYQFPPEVRGALAESSELRNTVVPMTTTDRNNLTAPELWDGRLIVNTTTDRINRYDSGTAQWYEIANAAEVLSLSGGTMTGDLVLESGTTSRAVAAKGTYPTFIADSINAAAGYFRLARNGLARWSLTSSDYTEGGSNDGSNLSLRRHSDDGTDIGEVLSVNRATGQVLIPSLIPSGKKIVTFVQSTANTDTNGFFALTAAAVGLTTVEGAIASAQWSATYDGTVMHFCQARITSNTIQVLVLGLTAGTGASVNRMLSKTGIGPFFIVAWGT